MPLRLFLVVLSVGAVAAFILFRYDLDGDDAPSETELLTAAAGTSQATSSPPDLALGQAYYRDGRYEEALAVYASVIERGRESDRQEARLASARILLWEERYDEAHEQAAAYLEEAGEEGNLAPGHFLSARALAGLGRDEEALAMFSRYVTEGGLAAAYARVEMARLLASMGRMEEASREAEAALSELPERRRPAVLLMMAQEFEVGSDAEALRWYGRLLSESESAADRALALWRMSVIKRSAGDPTWANDARKVVTEYPITSAASEALASLLDAGVEIDPFDEGLVYYRHFQNEEAREALQRSLEEEATGERAAAAHYYLGAIHERLGDDAAAIREYATAYEMAPEAPLADDALWWRGRLLEKGGRLEEALEVYELISSEYPGAELAPEAAFRSGLVLYLDGRVAEAASIWGIAAALAPSEDERGRALLWTAKAELASGKEEAGKSRLEGLRSAQPLSYYGLRADVLLRENFAGRETPAPASETPEAKDAGDWLAEVTGQSGGDGWMLWLDERWLRGLDLIALGMPREAGDELRELMYGPNSASRLLALSRTARAFGLTEISARSAQLILERVPGDRLGEAPGELLHLGYPYGYEELMESAEEAEGVSPLMMLALIRQESFFDPLAGSSAGASGLTQVIPSTGEEIARELGREFEVKALLRPETSVRFGAHYLANQLSTFDGNLYHALAAYNAGPGNAARWRSAAPDDVDLFVEEIDLGETKLYVRRVIENLAVYRYLHQGEAYPRLPY
ncbi:MAG: transglycosylase SLT domain-containing protein [Dehalococcoidia bacterium]|nr:transglycosylase SLT domain-containing protein [Dehalococcoidia bacterium]